MRRPRAAEDAASHGGAGHLGGGFRHGVAKLEKLLDVRIIQLAEVIPDAGFRGDHVGLIASVDDHVVRALLRTQVLALEVPCGVHQLDGIQSALAFPGRAGGVRGLSVKAIQD